MSIRLAIDVVAILAEIPLSAVSRVRGELLQHFARHAHLKTGAIFVSNATVARELRVHERHAREHLKALIQMGVLDIVKPAKRHFPRTFRINLDALRALREKKKGAPSEYALEQDEGVPPECTLAGTPGEARVHQSASEGAPISELGCTDFAFRVHPGSATKDEGTSKGVLKESFSSRNSSRTAPLALARGVRGLASGGDATGHTVDLPTWRSCWDRINVLVDEAPQAPDGYGYIRKRLVDQWPAVASDSRLDAAIRFVLEREA